MDNLTSVVSTQVREEELGRHHIPPDNVSCLHRTPTVGTHQDRSGLIPSCLRYLYEDNLFIGIQRVKLFKYPELGQYHLPLFLPQYSDTRCSWISILYILRHSVELFIIRNSLGSHQPCPFEFRHFLVYKYQLVIFCCKVFNYVSLKHFFQQSINKKCSKEDR